MRDIFAIALLVGSAFAFPSIMIEAISKKGLNKRQDAPNATALISRNEQNCGVKPCLIFNADEQYVSTSGEHAYADPGPNDIRGPCPGLNAAANHGYLPRNGIASVLDTIEGLGAVYNMGPDLAGLLAAYAIVMDGDPLTLRWSIGGPFEGLGLGLLRTPQGISYSHNKYEGDTSLTRPDAYLNNGDAISLNVDRFKRAYEAGGPEDRLTMDKFRIVNSGIQYDAIRENPYYFAPLFSTTLVAPAAYNFIINMMSNHTAEEPNGYLDGAVFQSFFAVEGEYPNFTWNPGKERIPDNWYRRTITNPYTNADVVADLLVGWAAYPNTFRFGGNTGGVNTYTGVDVNDITGGVFNAQNLFEGNNFACFFYQNQQQAVPDILRGLVSDISGAMDFWEEHMGWFNSLSCPELEQYDPAIFDQFPGASYSPTAPDTKVKRL